MQHECFKVMDVLIGGQINFHKQITWYFSHGKAMQRLSGLNSSSSPLKIVEKQRREEQNKKKK